MPGQGDCVGYGGYRGYGGYGFPWALISQLLLRNLRNMFAEISLQINQNIAAKQNLITNYYAGLFKSSLAQPFTIRQAIISRKTTIW